MDVSDINKVASRKRMNTDAEKLREKVSRETAKIIKLKVAQDTAYWDLKEKLQQLEANHERLQQNMVEVQMQYEAVSGQFQEELRLRPDTLNKLGGTREICDVLEDYGERLRRSVARCRADQQALGGAYGACGARVRQLAASARLAAERDRAQHQLLLRAHDQLADADLRRKELADSLERCNGDLSRREEAVTTLQAEVSRLTLALEERAQHLHTILAEHRVESEAAQARLATLQREAAAAAEVAAMEAASSLQRCTREREEARALVQRMTTELTNLREQKSEMEKVVDDRDQALRSLELEVSRVREYSSQLEAEKRELSERLNEAEREGEVRGNRLQELTCLVQTLESNLNAARESREMDAKQLSEALGRVSECERELDVKTSTVARLMADLKGEAQARYRADAALEAARRAHDEELDKQMQVIRDIRGEKARLQDKIVGMQATIDNVRKELTGPAPPPVPPAPPAERDRGGDDLLYSFLSDGSVDSDVLDAREVGRRFSALARGGGCGGAVGAPLSLSQIKKDFKMKRRTFFKNKRLENDSQKLKA